MATNDRVFVERILAGDRGAFDALVERYLGLVHGVIFQKVRRADEVEDLVQDVFCKAYEELSTLRDPDKFAPWLARMAANQAQTWLRQRRIQQLYKSNEKQGFWLTGECKTPEAQFESHEVKDVVWEALDQLRPEYRQILLLYHFENCRQRDIARFLNISLPTVKWRLLQARQSLQTKVDAVFEQGRMPFERRALRDKVMAALPLVALVETAKLPWWSIWPRRALPMAYAGAAGLVGAFIYFEVQAEQIFPAAGDAVPEATITVRLHQNPSAQGLNLAESGRRLYPPCAASGSSVERGDRLN